MDGVRSPASEGSISANQAVILLAPDAFVNMIITSDNVCTQIVLERLDRDELDTWCRRIGMTGTTQRASILPPGLHWGHPIDAVAGTTARDQGVLLERMEQGTAGAGEAKD